MSWLVAFIPEALEEAEEEIRKNPRFDNWYRLEPEVKKFLISELQKNLLKKRTELSGFKLYRKKPLIIQAKEMKEDFEVDTLEGLMQGKAGDFLIIGIKGERYPCAKDIFIQSYDLLKDNELQTEVGKH